MDYQKSLSNEATLIGAGERRSTNEKSLGDERTVGGGEAAGVDTLLEDIEVVDLLARYKVEGTLGQGGMGAVLLATDTRLGRKVAIKRILGEAARSAVAIQRFLTEAKAIAALNHPNIVQIYDYGRAKDGPFLIMEYVDGGSLADRCKQGAIPLEEAVELACQICDGLAKAHDAGIVHRDIKPANVLLNRDNLPKLTDFGLAKAEAADHGMTMTGAVMGTPDFMPPEQRRDASEVDHRSDLWSLAASVYQMVTGRSPKIIRFNDVPAALQDVLGKALEDRKDARYQSARELRDALKTSVRAAAAAAPAAAGDVGEGKCPACGVQNDPNRKFCKTCAASLVAPCLACSESIPVWDEVCGSCGAKQTPLVDARRQKMAARQAEAEGLLGDFEFDRATAIVTELRDEPHTKLRHLTTWATALLEQIETVRAERTRQAVEAVAEAEKHEAAHDYLSAAFALETIPQALRSTALPGHRETAATMLAKVTKMQAEARSLESLIKERLAAKHLDELLPDVEKLLSLQPDRDDIKQIRSQLVERQQKQASARDRALDTAKACIASHDYEGALAALAGVAAAAVTPEVIALREQAEGLDLQARTLSRTIKDAVAAKQLDGLLGTVEQYLAIKPADEDAVTLHQSLLDREQKFSDKIAARLDQARKLEQACRFDEATKLLNAIPEARRSREVVECLARSARLTPLRWDAIAALSGAQAGGFAEAIAATVPYRKALAESQLADNEFTALVASVQAAHDQEMRSRRLVRLTVLAAAGIAAVIVVVAADQWIQSSARASSLAKAIAASRWDEALTLDQTNVAALVGRARAKLAKTPADIEGAFADLDRATGIGREGATVEAARADARALRAREYARDDHLDEAAKELAEAVRGSPQPGSVESAREAIATGWVLRAQAAGNKGDALTLKRAVDAALAAGASPEKFATLRASQLTLEGVALQSQGDSKQAVAKLLEASLLDPAVATAVLETPANAQLRQAVVVEYRPKFDAAIAGGDWDAALRVAAAAGTMDRSASEWLGAAIETYPAGLASVPPDLLEKLPPEVFAFLPPAVFTSRPPLRNSIGIELKLIPPGTFLMGEAGGYEDETPHKVTLTKPFYLGVYEVTNAQWHRVMRSVPSGWGDDHAVTQVSWEDANEFCRRLSAIPEEKQAGRVYRVPTEAEWEYACRAGMTTKWSFGDDESRVGDYAWFVGNASGWTHRVGTRKPNAWGLFDMHGNVWEWCGDRYGNYGKAAVTDPQGPSDGSARVIRGGSWDDTAGSCRSAIRYRNGPSYRFDRLGFRLALSPSGAEREPPEAAAGN